MRLLLACCLALAMDAGEALRFMPAFAEARFDHPLWVGAVPGQAGSYLVLEQPGRVLTATVAGQIAVLLDLSADVRMPGGYTEEGVLAAAFHPRFVENRQWFLWQTTHRAGRLQTILARRTYGKADEEVLLTLDQPFGNHNGGDLHFGSDGFLYLSVGDGGAAGDPQQRAQHLGSLFGKILRLDVDHRDGGNPYRAPADNPFVGRAGVRPEIWAYGLRNVWRFAFDAASGELWAGDVGQNTREEVDIIVKGGNYGWNRREGLIAFRDGAKTEDMIDPVWDYPRSEGVSITGGFIYRGKALPDLVGCYLCADWGSRHLWSLRRGADGVRVRRLPDCPGQPSSIAADPDGEPLICCFDGGIYRLSGP